MKDININTENIKLDAFLKFCSEASSGGQAKEIINSKKVSVNGTIVSSRGKKLIPDDIVLVNDNEYRVVRV